MTDASDYREKGFVLLDGLLSPEIASAYLSIMQNALGDTPALQRRFHGRAHAVTTTTLDVGSSHFPFSLGILWGLTPAIERLAGVALLPSYAYGRVYPRGARLEVHSDRKANEHSLSLTLGYGDGVIWDFQIEAERLGDDHVLSPQTADNFGATAPLTLKMQPGDGVAYRGVHHRHARLAPNPNIWSAHLFMGWVECNGAQKEHAFDGLALPPKAQFWF